MKHGEVWEADLPPPVNYRPVLILSRDSMSQGRKEITVAYVTTQLRQTPAQVRLTPADGLSQISEANLDSINTVPKKQLVKRICKLSPAKMIEVRDAILGRDSLPA